ncbi:hypothetical protein Brsp07_04284 [Brucella sp. NBRC 14130]
MGFSHSRQFKTEETPRLLLPQLRKKQAHSTSHQLFSFWTVLEGYHLARF